jgi:hypothetical protein
MRIFAVIGLFLLSASGLFAQDGRVTVVQDSRVDSILSQYQAIRMRYLENPDTKGVPGYRIQVFFDSGSNSSDRAREARDSFIFKFPEIPAYISWKAPNYRVRAGDFRTRLEAERVLQQITPEYPNAWVIKDEINFPQIN